MNYRIKPFSILFSVHEKSQTTDGDGYVFSGHLEKFNFGELEVLMQPGIFLCVEQMDRFAFIHIDTPLYKKLSGLYTYTGNDTSVLQQKLMKLLENNFVREVDGHGDYRYFDLELKPIKKGDR